MKLSEIFDNVKDIEIDSLMSDSRKKKKNSIFFCVKGMMFDGHQFVNQAIANGAIVIVHSDDIVNKQNDVTYIKVKDVLSVYNKVADYFYDHPSHKLLMFGVTGTNGKSSIATMIHELLTDIEPCGYIGTIGTEYGNVRIEPTLTTPEIDLLQGTLKDMVDANMKACALEVSSIGIEQQRVEAVDFDVAIFTNLTHDHLDYHGTMENYFEAKKKLFDSLKSSAIAITNVDDDYGLKMVANTSAKIVTYGIDKEADYQASQIQIKKDGIIFTLSCYGQEYRLQTNLVAMFNLYNLLAVIAALHEKGVSIDSLLNKVNNIKQIKGRMERIDEKQPFNVIVDFAHTPDGIKQVCEFAIKITPKGKRIIVVFGSAGKRDVKKRPIFGAIADEYCDMIILTEDDPRDESILDIANEIASGIEKTNYIIIEDRFDAIRQAIEMVNVDDTILILGKGDEDFIYRSFGKEKYMGDDKVARLCIHKYYFQEME